MQPMMLSIVGGVLSLLLTRALGMVPSRKHTWGWNLEAANKALHFEQLQDHFDRTNLNTWMQAYYVNDSYWLGPHSDSPVFLYVGGEGPLGDGSVTHNFVVDLLPRTKAILFAVEHRYYGCHNASACPYNNRTVDHLRFLSSHQALADLARFHKFALHKYGLRPTSKWIVFGGSYPGMLAAFLRAEYPSLFHSAVASSAPVKAKLNMTEFEDSVASAYKLNVQGVEGSPACAAAISEGHRIVTRLLDTMQGRRILAQTFQGFSAQELEDPSVQRIFAGCGVAYFPAQTNNPVCDAAACGISQICKIMTNTSLGSPMARLAELRRLQNVSDLQMVHGCEMDWEMPGDMPDPDVNYWGYQTCTEFGFYQTCEQGTRCLFSQGLISFRNLHHKPDGFCAQQFGISTSQTLQGINQSNMYYGAKIAAATRILWVNGDVDPWHGLSHLSPPGQEQPVLWPVTGASHCAWMQAYSQNDQDSVKQARTTIYDQVSRWLAPDEVVEIMWI